MRIGRRRTLMLVAFVALLVASPEGLYRLLMLEIKQLPQPVKPLSAAETEVAWKSVGGVGEPSLCPLYPWGFWRLAARDHMSPGLDTADWVAKLHLMLLRGEGELSPASGAHEWLRRGALTIWLSRHWTPNQVLAYAYRAFANPSPHSGGDES